MAAELDVSISSQQAASGGNEIVRICEKIIGAIKKLDTTITTGQKQIDSLGQSFTEESKAIGTAVNNLGASFQKSTSSMEEHGKAQARNASRAEQYIAKLRDLIKIEKFSVDTNKELGVTSAEGGKRIAVYTAQVQQHIKALSSEGVTVDRLVRQLKNLKGANEELKTSQEGLDKINAFNNSLIQEAEILSRVNLRATELGLKTSELTAYKQFLAQATKLNIDLNSEEFASLQKLYIAKEQQILISKQLNVGGKAVAATPSFYAGAPQFSNKPSTMNTETVATGQLVSIYRQYSSNVAELAIQKEILNRKTAAGNSLTEGEAARIEKSVRAMAANRAVISDIEQGINRSQNVKAGLGTAVDENIQLQRQIDLYRQYGKMPGELAIQKEVLNRVTAAGGLVTDKERVEFEKSARTAAIKRAELAKLEQQYEKTNASVSRVSTGLTRLQLILSGIAYMAISRAVTSVADFYTNLSIANAVTEATTIQIAALENQARRLGETTVFTAGEAAQGIQYLGQAGMEVRDIMRTLPDALNLASAGSIDLGRSADIATNIMAAFGLKANEFGQAADVIAYAAAKSNTNVEQLAEGMKFAGPAARAVGLELGETAAIMGILSNAGIQSCFDKETDVLVRRDGQVMWVQWPDAKLTDEYATVNPVTKHIEWQLPTRMVRYRYQGRMYQIRNRNVDLLVTPDHRMWVKPKANCDRSGEKIGGDVTDSVFGGYRDVRAKDIEGLPVRYMTGGLKWKGKSPRTITIGGFDQSRGNWCKHVEKTKVDAAVWAAFLGWYVSEGSCDYRNGTYRTRITQNPGAVRDKMRSILKLLPWAVSEDAGGFVISGEQCYRQVAPLGKAPEKYLPEYVFEWGQDLLVIVMETIVEGDGDDNGAVYTTSPRLRDEIQTIAIMLGWSTTLSNRQCVGETSEIRGRTITARHDGWKVNVRRSQHEPWHNPYSQRGSHGKRLRPEANRAYDADGFTGDRWIDYDNDVFCVEVPNTLLLVRRGGKVVVSGNSMAGTSLRQSLIQLSKEPTKNAKKALAELGLTFDDVSLRSNSFYDVMTKLSQAGMGLGQAAAIFDTRAATAMLALSKMIPQWDKLNTGIKGASGTAERMAKIRLDNLTGDFRLLSSATEELILTLGDAGLLRLLRDTVTGSKNVVLGAKDLIAVWNDWWNTSEKSVESLTKYNETAHDVAANMGLLGIGIRSFNVNLAGSKTEAEKASPAIKVVKDQAANLAMVLSSIVGLKIAAWGLDAALGLTALAGGITKAWQAGILLESVLGLITLKFRIIFYALYGGKLIYDMHQLTQETEAANQQVGKMNEQLKEMAGWSKNAAKDLVKVTAEEYKNLFEGLSIKPSAQITVDDPKPKKLIEDWQKINDLIAQYKSYGYFLPPEQVRELEKLENAQGAIHTMMKTLSFASTALNSQFDTTKVKLDNIIESATRAVAVMSGVSPVAFTMAKPVLPEDDSGAGGSGEDRGKSYENFVKNLERAAKEQKKLNELRVEFGNNEDLVNLKLKIYNTLLEARDIKGGISKSEETRIQKLITEASEQENVNKSLKSFLDLQKQVTDQVKMAATAQAFGSDSQKYYVEKEMNEFVKANTNLTPKQEKSARGLFAIQFKADQDLKNAKKGEKDEDQKIKKAAEAYDKYIDKLERDVEVTNRKQELTVKYGRNQHALNAAMKNYEQELKIISELESQGITRDDERYEATRRQIKIRDAATESYEREREKVKKIIEVNTELANSMASAVGGAKSFRDAFIKLGDAAEQFVIKLATNKLMESLLGLFMSGGKAAAPAAGSKDFFSNLSPHAKGGAFFGGSEVTAFGQGGLFTSTTAFPMPNGTIGIAGERGDEVFMPASRMSNGDVGVRVQVPASASKTPVVMSNQFNIKIEGGSREQNKDAADQVSKSIENAMRSVVYEVLARERGNGGVLR